MPWHINRSYTLICRIFFWQTKKQLQPKISARWSSTKSIPWQAMTIRSPLYLNTIFNTTTTKMIYLLTEATIDALGHVDIVSCCPPGPVSSLLSLDGNGLQVYFNFAFNKYLLIELKKKNIKLQKSKAREEVVIYSANSSWTWRSTIYRLTNIFWDQFIFALVNMIESSCQLRRLTNYFMMCYKE